MKSALRQEMEADLISSEAKRRRFLPSLLGFHRATHDFILFGSVDRFESAKCFFDIDSPQKQIRGQIRTAAHFREPFKNPSSSKFIYEAIDATEFWIDLNYHTTPPA